MVRSLDILIFLLAVKNSVEFVKFPIIYLQQIYEINNEVEARHKPIEGNGKPTDSRS